VNLMLLRAAHRPRPAPRATFPATRRRTAGPWSYKIISRPGRPAAGRKLAIGISVDI